MRRTRRRRKYTWLPIDGTPNTDETDFGICTINNFALDLSADGNPVQGITNLTFDQDQDTVAQGLGNESTPLVSLLGNEYFLKRIVGKVWVQLDIFPGAGDHDPATYPAALVAAAFFIARQDSATPNTPLSWSTRADDYNPLSTTVIREPWIWRRAWLLGQYGTPDLATNITPQTLNASFGFPPSNALYGSVADGPHVDARTARRVRQEERLYFTAAAQTWPMNGTIPTPLTLVVNVGVDVRLLGALRKPRNRGSF